MEKTKTENDTELIWVPKEISERYNKIGDSNARMKMINEYLQTRNKTIQDEFKTSLESLEEDAVIYEGLILKVKKRFEQAKNESLNAFYACWEKYDADRTLLEKKINTACDVLDPLQKKIDIVNESLCKISTFGFDKLIETFQRFTGLYDKEKEMFEFLLKNYKPTEKKG